MSAQEAVSFKAGAESASWTDSYIPINLLGSTQKLSKITKKNHQNSSFQINLIKMSPMC